MGHSEKKTGVIISVDDYLQDMLRGYIFWNNNGKLERIRYYHPKSEKFYIKIGKKVKFRIDEIDDFIVSINQTLKPDKIATFEAILSKVEVADSKYDETEIMQLQQCGTQVEVYWENDGSAQGGTTPVALTAPAKKKVAVDLEPR